VGAAKGGQNDRNSGLPGRASPRPRPRPRPRPDPRPGGVVVLAWGRSAAGRARSPRRWEGRRAVSSPLGTGPGCRRPSATCWLRAGPCGFWPGGDHERSS
jgi:hypothetical protein